jgi:ergothioneine biosynthesis protein EgtB
MPLNHDAASQARRSDAPFLAQALADTRAQTLRTAAEYAAALPGLQVPLRGELNPPAWELGHIAWFQEWWIARNPQLSLGVRADPEVPRPPSLLANADTLYDSSAVAHATRWRLDLPEPGTTHRYQAQGLDATLARLRESDQDDDSLYFFRLCLFHEDMHNEAAIYMANALGFAVRAVQEAAAVPQGSIALPAATHRMGWHGPGFAFDNELGSRSVTVGGFEIDAAPVSNERFSAFVDAGGYAQPRYWSAAGRAWLAAGGKRWPRFWRREAGRWQQRWFGNWRALDPGQPAMNLCCFEAEAWCAWAGRRLPGEAEWELAASSQPAFAWGDVWEWTADTFAPYRDFAAHPYRDYSAPWFGSRRVLRGGSVATHARIKHPRYRNFFPPERNDIFAGFRSCAA